MKNIGKVEFTRLVKESETGRPLVLDLYTDWCMPCKFAAPHFERLSKDYSNKLDFIKINVDNEPEIAQMLRVQGVPTFMILKGKEILTRVVGANIPALEKGIKKIIDEKKDNDLSYS